MSLPGTSITAREAHAAILAGRTVRLVVGSDPEDPVCLHYLDRCREDDGEEEIYTEAIGGWSEGVKEAICLPDSPFYVEFVSDPPPLSLTITDQVPPQLERPVLCDDCAEVADFMPEFPLLSPAARHIAHGIVHGGWACDHIDFTTDDTAQAYEALYAVEMKRRDTLRAGLLAIYDHARLDEAERGFGEASRYYAIAADAIEKSGLGSMAVHGRGEASADASH